MFDERRKRRSLRKEIAALKEEREQQARAHEQATDRNDPEQRPFYFGRLFELTSLQMQLEELETDRLLRKARRLGVEFPDKEEWWVEDEIDARVGPDGSYIGKYHLSDAGKTGVSKLIREERKKNIEWWVKIITPILSSLIALLGLIIAIISVSKK